MARAQSLDMTLTLKPDDTVEVREKKGTLERVKTISLQSLADALITDFKLDSGMLPPGCRRYVRGDKNDYILVEFPEQKHEVKYGDHTYKAVVPWTIFAITLERRPGEIRQPRDIRIYAAKGPIVDDNTQLFFFPFSNVYYDDRVCWGSGRDPFGMQYKSLLGISGILELFYSSKFNSDLDGGRYTSIRVLKADLRGELKPTQISGTANLFEHLATVDKFPVEVLKPHIKVREVLDRMLRGM